MTYLVLFHVQESHNHVKDFKCYFIFHRILIVPYCYYFWRFSHFQAIVVEGLKRECYFAGQGGASCTPPQEGPSSGWGGAGTTSWADDTVSVVQGPGTGHRSP